MSIDVLFWLRLIHMRILCSWDRTSAIFRVGVCVFLMGVKVLIDALLRTRSRHIVYLLTHRDLLAKSLGAYLALRFRVFLDGSAGPRVVIRS